MTTKQPSFIIVGAPKAGTTALCVYLNRHPEIFIPPKKELNYFNKDIPANHKAKNIDEYLNFFSEGKEKVCGEKSPSYLRSKIAAQEIYAFNPDTKIIIMLREPVALLHSFHSQLLLNGSSEDIQDFQLALEAETDRRQGKRIPQHCSHKEKLFYRDVVKFTEQVERYFNTFGRDQVHIIIFDDFQKDPAKVYRETLEFIGVDPTFQTEFPKKNANRKVRNTQLQYLLKYPPSKILEIGKFFIPLPRSMRRGILQRIKNKLKKINTHKTDRDAIDPEFKRKLKKEFAPDIERLSGLLGRDLTYWSRD
ncbi:MAG TPA: sulfotransferase [Cyanobacteria bacterium UBA12227]|nr:sulfotransferase [Cyanobacteria bacterium UBA12227]HAX89694.1 sulfotransferase [Cyanobacteria bacterium UBA11370]HBY75757.1 sulfotransferase [Cyanobacteria bacterium UBA11148]